MANGMTVEGMIELLREEHPQALVLIQTDAPHGSSSLYRPKCYVYSPYGVRVPTTPAQVGQVLILCDRHDC